MYCPSIDFAIVLPSFRGLHSAVSLSRSVVHFLRSSFVGSPVVWLYPGRRLPVYLGGQTVTNAQAALLQSRIISLSFSFTFGLLLLVGQRRSRREHIRPGHELGDSDGFIPQALENPKSNSHHFAPVRVAECLS